MNHLKSTALLGLLFIHTQHVAHAAVEPVKGEDEIELHPAHLTAEQLAAGQPQVESDADVSRKMATEDRAIDRLAAIGNTRPNHGSLSNVIGTSLPLDNDKPIPVLDIAKAIINSFDKYNNLQESAPRDPQKKTAIQRSNQTFAAGLLIVVAFTNDPDSKEGRAIDRLLWLGQQNANGSSELSVMDASTRLMDALTKSLLKKGKLDTAETLLAPSMAAAWPELSPNKRRARAAQLIGLR